MALRPIVSDFGGVIVDFDNSLYINGFARITGCRPEKVEEEIFPGLSLSLHRGDITGEEFRKLLESGLRVPLPVASFRKSYCEIFTLKEDTADLLRRLKRRFQLCLLSNTNEVHWDYCRKQFPILDILDHRIVSHEVRVVKPEPAIYLEAMRVTNSLPQECIFMDDIEEYVEEARKLNMHAIHFASASQAEREIEEIVKWEA